MDTNYSIIFDGVDVWKKWKMAPTSEPCIVMPERKRTTVEIPGRDGYWDLSAGEGKHPVYNSRKGTLEFVICDEAPFSFRSSNSLRRKLDEIKNFFRGRIMRVELCNDPGWYYDGYVDIKKIEIPNDGNRPTVSLNYIFDPYKTRKYTSTQAIDFLSMPLDDSYIDISRFCKDAVCGIGGAGIVLNPLEMGLVFCGSSPISLSITKLYMPTSNWAFGVSDLTSLTIEVSNKELGNSDIVYKYSGDKPAYTRSSETINGTRYNVLLLSKPLSLATVNSAIKQRFSNYDMLTSESNEFVETQEINIEATSSLTYTSIKKIALDVDFEIRRL